MELREQTDDEIETNIDDCIAAGSVRWDPDRSARISQRGVDLFWTLATLMPESEARFSIAHWQALRDED